MGSAGHKWVGARRLGIKAVTGLLAIGLIAGTGTSEAAKADPAATVRGRMTAIKASVGRDRVARHAPR